MNAFLSSELALGLLLASAIKGTVILAGAWLFVFLLRKFSAALRHHVWAAAILASLALPILIFALPAWHSAALGNAAALFGAPHAKAAVSVSPLPSSANIQVTASDPLIQDWPFLLLLAWGAGFCFLVLRLFVGLARLAWVSAQAKPLFEESWMRDVLARANSLKIGRSVRLLECRSALAMPLTWGVFRPVIVLPSSAAEWTAERRSIVLAHEMAHIARHDWLLQICAQLVSALYWFHPLAWLGVAQLRRESERACDDAVLNSGIAPSAYASQLLDLARALENPNRAWSTALAIARPSNLERRFAAMLNPSVNRRHLSRRTRWLVALAGLCLVLPLAALRLPAQNLSGKTSGSVHDPSGAGIANATIVMSNHEADTIDMTTSDREGHFEFKGLPAGKYELDVFRPGFQKYESKVTLDPGRDFREVLTLRVGAVTEIVQVVPVSSKEAAPIEKPAGKPNRLGLGGNIEAAKLETKVQPIYPPSAKDAGVEGTVVLHAVIGKDGKPLSLRVMNSQIDPDLARSAVEAVSQWRYLPMLLNGEPIEVDTTINVTYSLAH